MSLKKFQRTKFRAYVCLGARQKSMRKYRKCKGRHNKTRQCWKGRPPKVRIGYKREVDNATTIVVQNIKDLLAADRKAIILIGTVGMKRKIEIAREAEKNKIKIANLNIRKVLKTSERQIKYNQKTKAEAKTGEKK